MCCWSEGPQRSPNGRGGTASCPPPCSATCRRSASLRAPAPIPSLERQSSMSMPRRLEPELLDQLPADDPRAIRSRRDLRRVNAWMLNASRMAGALIKHAGPETPRTMLDLGSGDGQFMLQVARRLAPHWPDVTVTLLDQQNIVSSATREGFTALGWRVNTVSADVFEFLAQARSSP